MTTELQDDDVEMTDYIADPSGSSLSGPAEREPLPLTNESPALSLLAADAKAGEDWPDLYGPLIGSWAVESSFIAADGTTRQVDGEWHFERVLGGMGVQDVLFAVGSPREQYGPHCGWSTPAADCGTSSGCSLGLASSSLSSVAPKATESCTKGTPSMIRKDRYIDGVSPISPRHRSAGSEKHHPTAASLGRWSRRCSEHAVRATLGRAGAAATPAFITTAWLIAYSLN